MKEIQLAAYIRLKLQVFIKLQIKTQLRDIYKLIGIKKKILFNQ